MTERDLFDGLIASWLVLSVLVFLALLRVAAPYGRHARRGWGPQIRATLGWMVMEAPSPLVFGVLFLAGGRHGVAELVFLAMWQLHYLDRAFVDPWRRRRGAQQMPVAIVAMAVLFNLVNATANGRWLFGLGPAHPASWLADPRFIAGVALFAIGFAVNRHADEVLRRLRAPGETAYRIPHGGLYRFVSCPNYLGELIEWAGFALATWSLPALGFAVWTAANLVPRALSHHRWYRRTFPDYPPQRRALVPFVL